MTQQCAVCKKFVADSDVEEHLATNHIGPHYFWFNGVKHRTMSPSALMSDVKALANASPCYQAYEERDGKEIPYGDSTHVDLTHEPHFWAVPPAHY